MTRRQRRTYTDEFKKQIVLLYNAGKSRKEILIMLENQEKKSYLNMI